MVNKRFLIATLFIAVALCIYALHTYAAYTTGVYMGKAAFTAADYQNRHCLSLRADSSRHNCKARDLDKDSVMEDALASANVIPSLSDSTAIHTGFRVGWREARTATFH